MTITYRPCTTHDEFATVAQLEKTIWAVDDADVITAHMLHVIHRIGGIVFGAFDGDTMVGMAVATPMQEQGLLWSHMAGVLPNYQGQDIGYQIKQVQRDWALKHGYHEMRWSFDPAMRRNANFNFRKLGVTTNIYHNNFYGMMSDGINAGVASDRFEAVWRLNHPKITYDVPDDVSFLLTVGEQQLIINTTLTQPYHAVACPYDFPAIKSENLNIARMWRQMMAKAFSVAFAGGYHVVDFVTEQDNQFCYYVLHNPEVHDVDNRYVGLSRLS
ncbi:MAG: GNAT family N-acetyltransferase [Chloroflexota bacterium]